MTRQILGVATALLLAAGAGMVSGSAQTASTRSTGAGSDAIVPFKIHVPDDVLRDLKARLARTRFPDEIPGTGWDYGTDLAYLKSLVAYWQDRFDWRAQERKLN